jgi:hypothetical protein
MLCDRLVLLVYDIINASTIFTHIGGEKASCFIIIRMSIYRLITNDKSFNLFDIED